MRHPLTPFTDRPAPARRRPVLRALRGRQYLADQAVRLVVRAGAEPQRAHATCGGRAGLQRPEPLDAHGATAPHAQQPEGAAVAVGADPAVTEVAHQQRAGEPAEAGWGDREAPRRVQRAAAGDAYHLVGDAVEAVHEGEP